MVCPLNLMEKEIEMKSIFDREPDSINELGVKWWEDVDLTEYAQHKDKNNISLPNIKIFCVEEPDGYRTRLMVQDGQSIFENTNLEAMAGHIDIMKLVKQFK